jgi:hypothetical protein
LIERLGLLFEQRQIMQRIVNEIGRLVAARMHGDRFISKAPPNPSTPVSLPRAEATAEAGFLVPSTQVSLPHAEATADAGSLVPQMIADRQRRTAAAIVSQPLGSPLTPTTETTPTSARSDMSPRSFGGKRLSPSGKEKPTPKRRGVVIHARTKIGRTFLAKSGVIALNTESTIILIDDEIKRLQARRLNDPDSIAERDATVKSLQTIKKSLAKLQRAALDFPDGKIIENKLTAIVKEGGKSLDDFLKMEGVKVINQTVTIGLICGGTALGCAVGMPVIVAVGVAGAVCAHKELAEVLKAAKGVFKWMVLPK